MPVFPYLLRDTDIFCIYAKTTSMREHLYSHREIGNKLVTKRIVYVIIGKRKFHYREEYVKKSVDKCKKIWESCGFSNDLSLVYEKGYEDHKGKEHAFLESCIKKLGYSMYSFVAEDLEEENLVGRRYVWKTDEIDMEKLAREIILSDIGGKLSLAESVFVVDNKNDMVFFLYDDRGILFYTEREK